MVIIPGLYYRRLKSGKYRGTIVALEGKTKTKTIAIIYGDTLEEMQERRSLSCTAMHDALYEKQKEEWRNKEREGKQ